MVQAEDRDPIATIDAQLGLQGARGLFDTRGKCRIAQGFALELDGGLVGGEGSITLDQTAEVHRQSSDSSVS